MSGIEPVLVCELERFSAEDLRSRGYIKLRDPENLTDELLDKLKALVNGVGHSRTLDLDAVDKKLKNLATAAPSSLLSRSSVSVTPDPDDPVENEAVRQDCLRGELKAYNALILDGGQPSHRPDEFGFDNLDEPGPNAAIISYWRTVTFTDGWSILRTQWHEWQEFREYQERWRQRHWKPEWWERRIQHIREYRKEKGLNGEIFLQQDRKKQSRLDDWKEFQFREYKKADAFVRDMKKAAEDKKVSEVRLQAAIEAGNPQREIEWIREQAVGFDEGRRGTAEIELERQNMYLEWIDKQLPIIAAECQPVGDSLNAMNDSPRPASAHLGKRKRSTEETADRKMTRSKALKISPMEDSHVQLEVDDTLKPANLLDTDTNRQDSTAAEQPPPSKRSLRRKCNRIAKSIGEPADQDVAAASLQHEAYPMTESRAHGKESVPVISDERELHVFQPPSEQVSPVLRSNSRVRKPATRLDRAQIRSGSDARRRQVTSDRERKLREMLNTSRVNKPRNKRGKTRDQQAVSQKNGQKGNALPQARAEQRRRKDVAGHGRGTVLRRMIAVGEPVRRSDRISQLSAIFYPK